MTNNDFNTRAGIVFKYVLGFTLICALLYVALKFVYAYLLAPSLSDYLGSIDALASFVLDKLGGLQ